MVGSDAFEGAFAKKAQQLHLNRRVNLANLIEKQRAAIGLLKPPDAPFVCAGEGAFLMAEQFAFQKRRRQRCAMDGDHRLLGARAEVVNRLGDEFLARAAFAQHKHTRACGGDLLDDFKNFLHHRRLADDIFDAELRVNLRTQLAIFRFQFVGAQGACDAHLQFVNLHPPLGNVIIRALPHRVHGHFLAAVSGHQNANRRLAQRFGALDEVQPAHARHALIRQQHIKRVLLQQPHRALAILGEVHIVPILQRRTQSLPRGLLVINY